MYIHTVHSVYAYLRRERRRRREGKDLLCPGPLFYHPEPHNLFSFSFSSFPSFPPPPVTKMNMQGTDLSGDNAAAAAAVSGTYVAGPETEERGGAAE